MSGEVKVGERLMLSKQQEWQTDGELVRRVLEGERLAFDVLVRRHRAAVLRLARMTVGDWDAAEDVAQQSLLAAYRNLSALRDGSDSCPGC